MPELHDRATVETQYADESRLATRVSVWRGSSDGRHPHDIAAAAVAAGRPASLLEVGCGTGGFAARVAAEVRGCRVVATDRSLRMVELTRERGVDACRADVTDLPFDADSFDAVAAVWMLYHVAELDRGLAELRRVLRPGGTLVAVTNGDAHLATLLCEAGGGPLVSRFSTENGAASLRVHFAEVTQTDLATRAVFPDHATAVAYLATFDSGLAASLPFFAGARHHAGATSVFVAR